VRENERVTGYPATPLRVVWSELDPKRYEDLVSALLSILHPTSIRTDGSGGDGGRDVHFPGPEGLEIFELKSFTGRVTTNRWKQVKRSLNRAMEMAPKTWTVVCPIDLTKEERDKFEAIATEVDTLCVWQGKTWLDARMAEHPCVPRYFVSDVNNEIRDLARLFEQERAALTNGVPDALDRIRSLAERCDELDPFYRVDLATDTGAGTVTASLVPRYPGAERDRPISLQATLVFPDLDSAEATRAQFQAAYDFGIGIDVPAEYIQRVVVDAPAGLGGEFGSGTLQLGPRELRGVPEFRLQLRVTTPDGSHITTLPLVGKARNIGERGLIAELSDSAGGLIHMELRVDWVDHTLHLHHRSEPRPCLPSATLPALRFMAAIKPPNRVTCCLADGTPLGPPIDLTTQVVDVDERNVKTVQLLARVQDATSTWFDVPEEMSGEDLEDLVVADRLLSGQVVRGSWERYTPGFSASHAAEMLENMMEMNGNLAASLVLWHKAEETLVIADHELPLGRVSTVMYSARLLDPEEAAEAVRAAGPTDSVRIELVPGKTDTFEKWRGEPEDRPKEAAGS